MIANGFSTVMGELAAKGWAKESRAAQLVVCHHHLRTGRVLDAWHGLVAPDHAAAGLTILEGLVFKTG